MHWVVLEKGEDARAVFAYFREQESVVIEEDATRRVGAICSYRGDQFVTTTSAVTNIAPDNEQWRRPDGRVLLNDTLSCSRKYAKNRSCILSFFLIPPNASEGKLCALQENRAVRIDCGVCRKKRGDQTLPLLRIALLQNANAQMKSNTIIDDNMKPTALAAMQLRQ